MRNEEVVENEYNQSEQFTNPHSPTSHMEKLKLYSSFNLDFLYFSAIESYPRRLSIMAQETVRPAFTGRERPLLSYGIDFRAAAARHATETFNASRIYVICSGSLARNTDSLDRLTTALGPEKVVGRRIGMQSHTLWSEVLEIVEDARNVRADLLLTLGAGSLTDGAKIAALVLYPVVYVSGLTSHANTI